MRLRRASTLVVTLEGSSLRLSNYLTRESHSCGSRALEVLAIARDWRDAEWYFEQLSAFDARSVARSLLALIRASALLVEGSSQAVQDQSFINVWRWGPSTGHYHFMAKNAEFVSTDEARATLVERSHRTPLPELYRTNAGLPTIRLRRETLRRPLLRLMAARRTCRSYKAASLSIHALGAVLFAGLGILAFLEEKGAGQVPLKTTPSGGGRNPYEAYVLAHRVSRLAAGVYHYSAVDHTLGELARHNAFSASSALGGQSWADEASAVIFLVADFRRTMWKYRHSNAYRFVLIEAGHIAQNMVLAATDLGLAAATTGAISDSVAETLLQSDLIAHSVVYAVTIGAGGDTGLDGWPRHRDADRHAER